MAWILKDVSGDDRNDDSSFEFQRMSYSLQVKHGYRAHLARRQDTVQLSDDGLITAKVRRGIEHKADVEPEVVSLIITQQLDRKPENFVRPRGAGHEPSAEGTLSDDVL